VADSHLRSFLQLRPVLVYVPGDNDQIAKLGALDCGEQAVASRHCALPSIQVGAEHLGIGIAVNVHHSDLLCEKGPA
jgi:hypothetical protein